MGDTGRGTRRTLAAAGGRRSRINTFCSVFDLSFVVFRINLQSQPIAMAVGHVYMR